MLISQSTEQPIPLDNVEVSVKLIVRSWKYVIGDLI